MSKINPDSLTPELSGLLELMKKEYQKTAIFREERVRELKNSIQEQSYHVTGRAVVERWFSTQTEPKF